MSVFLRRTVPRVALVLIASIAFVQRLPGQQGSQSDHPIVPVVGIVKSISGKVISVDAGERIVAVFADERTEVWKGKIFHDLSLVQVGDDFAARCRADSSGGLVAELIELNVVNFFGIITKVDGGGESFDMLTNPNADAHSGYVKKTLKVTVDSDTLFSASAKEDLEAGWDVQMVGLDLKNGRVRATRLTVYEGNRPVRMGNGKMLPPTRPRK